MGDSIHLLSPTFEDDLSQGIALKLVTSEVSLNHVSSKLCCFAAKPQKAIKQIAINSDTKSKYGKL